MPKFIILICRMESVPLAKQTEPNQVKARFSPIVRVTQGGIPQVFTCTAPDGPVALRQAQARFPFLKLYLAVEEKASYDALQSRLAYNNAHRRDNVGENAGEPDRAVPA